MNCVACYKNLTQWRGRYYCDSCLDKVVKDPDERKRLGLAPLKEAKRK